MPIDPVQFGELRSSVRAVESQVDRLARSVEELNGKVDHLVEFKSTSKGIVAGFILIAGGIGAVAHRVLDGLLK